MDTTKTIVATGNSGIAVVPTISIFVLSVTIPGEIYEYPTSLWVSMSVLCTPLTKKVNSPSSSS